jgi:hypothetical protein
MVIELEDISPALINPPLRIVFTGRLETSLDSRIETR